MISQKSPDIDAYLDFYEEDGKEAKRLSNFDEFKLKLNTKSDEEIKTLIDSIAMQWHKDKGNGIILQADLLRLKDEDYDEFAKHIFGLMRAYPIQKQPPHLHYYTKLSEWTPEEAVILSMDKDPRTFSRKNLLKHKSLAITNDYDERLEILNRYVQNEKSKEHIGLRFIELQDKKKGYLINPVAFIEIAKKTGILLPRTLEKTIKKVYQDIDLEKKYKNLEIEKESLNKQVSDLQDEKSNLTSQVQELITEKENLDKQVNELQALKEKVLNLEKNSSIPHHKTAKCLYKGFIGLLALKYGRDKILKNFGKNSGTMNHDSKFKLIDIKKDLDLQGINLDDGTIKGMIDQSISYLEEEPK